MSTTYQDSFVSTDSSTTYPSSLSSLPSLALGLHNSPTALKRLANIKMNPPRALRSTDSHSALREEIVPSSPDNSVKLSEQRARLRPTSAIAKTATTPRVEQSSLRPRISRANLISRETEGQGSPRIRRASSPKGEDRRARPAPAQQIQPLSTGQQPSSANPVPPEETPSPSRTTGRLSAKTQRPSSAPQRPLSIEQRSTLSAKQTPTSSKHPQPHPKATASQPLRNPAPLVHQPSASSQRTSGASANDTRSIAIPRAPQTSPTQGTLRPPSQQPIGKKQALPTKMNPPPSPTGTASTMAEDWEAELQRNAQRFDEMSLAGKAKEREMRRAKAEQREKDREWERSGTWDARDQAREAEERTRRDVGREIGESCPSFSDLLTLTLGQSAYPPSMPRIPIRAAPSGVTSIHVGVRPRLHPSHASVSMERNQPDATMPLPLFSPLGASQSTNLPDSAPSAPEKDDTFRGSFNQLYTSELAEKAKEEFENWKKKKEEREGGIGENNSEGVGLWNPKDRMVARPGNIEGIAHSDGYESRAAPVPPMDENAQEYQRGGYPYPYQMDPNMYMGYDGNGKMPQQGYPGPFYGPQGYWDQDGYWWPIQGDMMGYGGDMGSEEGSRAGSEEAIANETKRNAGKAVQFVEPEPVGKARKRASRKQLAEPAMSQEEMQMAWEEQ
ncbi:hypothetical protein P7C73_g1353, partial [Tremellales sp. Uapishka_1]